MQIGAYNENKDWFSMYWARKRADLSINQFKFKTGEQLYQVSNELEEDLKQFWKFRVKNTLSQINLHIRRKHRMIAAFAFQKFKV